MHVTQAVIVTVRDDGGVGKTCRATICRIHHVVLVNIVFEYRRLIQKELDVALARLGKGDTALRA